MFRHMSKTETIPDNCVASANFGFSTSTVWKCDIANLIAV